jgi:hypothetical protein
MPSTDQTDAPAETQATSDFHWVMTVQTPDGRVNTRTAVITVPAGFTRAAAFEYVFKQFKADYGSPLTVLFFDLQPNKL